MFISQHKYIAKLLSDASMDTCKRIATSLSLECQSTHSDNVVLENPEMYKRIVGRFLYLEFSGPEIIQATQTLSEYMICPTVTHWQPALHVLKYLNGSSTLSLFYSSNQQLNLIAFDDVDE